MPMAKMNIATQHQRDREDDQVDQEGDQAARRDAVEQFRIGCRIIGVRLDLMDTPIVASLVRPAMAIPANPLQSGCG